MVARNETGRLSLKLNILLKIIKFWIHLESLPEIISSQLANEEKTSFMLQCDYSNQGHPTKFSTNLTNKNRGG